MTLSLFARLGGAVLLAASLAGCIDATLEVDVTSTSAAKATMTQVMDKSIYEMVQQSQESGDSDVDFCDGGEVKVEGDKATCTIVKEGGFAELTFNEEQGEESVKFTNPAPNEVRVAFPTADLKSQINGDDAELDAQTKAMMTQFFEGHSLTIKVTGGEIIDTNMDLSADKRTASKELPFLDIINGTVELPDELYATVRK